VILGTIVVLALAYLIVGRIRIAAGRSQLTGDFFLSGQILLKRLCLYRNLPL
jgi:hypothetical protein